MQVDLSAAEATLLADIINGALRGVREEIHKAEVAEYKEMLRQREALLVSLLNRLGARPANVSSGCGAASGRGPAIGRGECRSGTTEFR